MTREKLTISADDFGISQKANDNILRLIKLKKINRVAILINGLLSPEEIKKLLNSNIKLDIHLDLKKISPNKNNRTQKSGTLKRVFSFLFLYFTGKMGAAEAEISWENQIEKFKEKFGKKPDGANSHQHIHFFPSYSKILIKLCKKHGIEYLRFGRSCLKKNLNLVCFILNTLRLKNLKNFSQSEIATSEFLVSLDWIKNVRNFFNKIPEGKLELVCHPERKEEFEIIKKYF